MGEITKMEFGDLKTDSIHCPINLSAEAPCSETREPCNTLVVGVMLVGGTCMTIEGSQRLLVGTN